MMKKITIGFLILLLLIAAIITTVSAGETPSQIIVKEGPAVLDESMVPPNVSAEEKQQEKARLLKEANTTKLQKIQTKIVNKEIASDRKSSRAFIQVGLNEDAEVFITKLTQKGIKVMRWENEVVGADGKTNFVGMHSVNNLSNEENLRQLDHMTAQFVENYKVTAPKKRLSSLIVVGSVDNIDNLQVEGGAN